eukprot:TRINITY_DN5749_c0_g1_i1.p1 TRINITY_DN5749_c0_g1~~TRINITY_DN5749_c0_g1_i1.p1  ORF type:complete len:774 (+),score=160.64 TRINITY_DN5749_c0_g1_i1:100-2421(+)
MSTKASEDIRIGVLTSGGDAQGMNSAVRAVVRQGLVCGASVYAIYEGYAGMVSGGSMIKKLNWDDVSGWQGKGGTEIGTSRCPEFMESAGRRTAVKNLIQNGIDRLIIIGGDGSLTGANILKQEWSSHLDALIKSGDIKPEVKEKKGKLYIAGLVGSIDNDMCGTDYTIGYDSAINRVVEALDSISSTAASHSRTFVVEVMGRNCGCLALYASIAVGADWVFLPEFPPQNEWEEKLCVDITQGRKLGRRQTIIVVAEGAKDRNGNPIHAQKISDAIEKKLKLGVRVTILGHVQRGGIPSAWDRMLGTVMGIEAVNVVLDPAKEKDGWLIGIIGSRVMHTPLMPQVERTKSVAKLIENRSYSEVMKLRGSDFEYALTTQEVLSTAVIPTDDKKNQKLNFAIMTVGAPAPGMNACIRCAVRWIIHSGHNVWGVRTGFTGILDNDVVPMTWFSVNGYAGETASLLGCDRNTPDINVEKVAQVFKKYNFHGLIIIGGWEAYMCAISLKSGRSAHPEFNIPIVCVPATVSNNCPATGESIGCDTALNVIVNTADALKKSAYSSGNRLFIMEVQGGRCGYLALMGAIAGGAQVTYLPEKELSLATLISDVEKLKKRAMKYKRSSSLIINNEASHSIYTTNVLTKIFKAESNGAYSVRKNVLGHAQQGNTPSPMDRINGALAGRKAAEEVLKNALEKKSTIGGIGIYSGVVSFRTLDSFLGEMDLKNRRSNEPSWWKELDHIVGNLRRRPVEEPVTVVHTPIAGGARRKPACDSDTVENK